MDSKRCGQQISDSRFDFGWISLLARGAAADGHQPLAWVGSFPFDLPEGSMEELPRDGQP